MFQSTHLREVRRSGQDAGDKAIMFQSTHLREVRRYIEKYDLRGNDVSIHAPTRGATHAAALMAIPLKVSIHAPTRGATLNKI